jgi:hypothetical protein
VILTIDTTQPLNDTDRTLLRTLLDGATTTTGHGHTPAPVPRGRSAADLGAVVAATAGRTGGPGASARGPVAAQPGVTFTESTSEDEDPAG